jgi:hypothetical protein
LGGQVARQKHQAAKQDYSHKAGLLRRPKGKYCISLRCSEPIGKFTACHF